MAATGNEVRRKVVLAGVGYSQIARYTGRSEGALALEACRNAIDDSGLSRDDIDGLAVWPDRIASVFEGPSITYMQRALGLSRTRYWQAFGAGPAQLSSVVGAIYAIAAGAAETVICYRAHLRQEQRFYVAGSTGSGGGTLASGDLAYKAPYGVPAGTPRFALWAQRHAHEYGTTDEHRGALVLTCRDHAQRNPRAVWNGTPLTMDDYLAADVISTPLRILDCDMPVDGAVALVFTTRRPGFPPAGTAGVRRGDRPRHGAVAGLRQLARRHVHGGAASPATKCGRAPTSAPATSTWPRSTTASPRSPSAGSRTSAPPRRARPVTGCSRARAAWAARCRICTDGGQLGAGRLHGFGKVAETVQQLRGECGERQVPGAEVGLTCAGGGPYATSMLLTV